MIKVFEAFAGYGSQAMALKKAGIEFESVGISEIDKYAVCAYKAVHGDVKNYGDISKIDETKLPDFNLFTYSFPCTDVSVAGKGEGLSTGTRSGLLWECERIIKHKLPEVLLMENVKNLIGKKFKGDFDRWCRILESLGYENYYQVMNAKEHGIPQNRERVFMVSIFLGGSFKFPEKEELKTFLRDIVEDEVGEKYYLQPEQYEKFIARIVEKYNNQDSSYCIDSSYSKGGDWNQYVNKSRRQLVVAAAQRGRNPVNSTSGVPGLKTKQMIESEGNEVSNCITTVQKDNLLLQDFKVRRLTPIETFRLMDVSDEDFYKMKNALNETFYNGKDKSNSQLYKLAGNSIVVNCMTKIFKNLYKTHGYGNR